MTNLDLALVLVLLLFVVLGYMNGLTRSLLALGFALIAAYAAARLSPMLSPYLEAKISSPLQRNAAAGMIVFLGVNVLLDQASRMAFGRANDQNTGILDRMGGVVLGAGRALFVAILLVMIFQELIPPGHAPAWWSQSRLRPYLGVMADAGLRAMPGDLRVAIQQLKTQQR